MLSIKSCIVLALLLLLQACAQQPKMNTPQRGTSDKPLPQSIYDYNVNIDKSLGSLNEYSKRVYEYFEKRELMAKKMLKKYDGIDSSSDFFPGENAFVALLYEELGDYKMAEKYYRQEKAFFPESTVFMDAKLQELERKKK